MRIMTLIFRKAAAILNCDGCLRWMRCCLKVLNMHGETVERL